VARSTAVAAVFLVFFVSTTSTAAGARLGGFVVGPTKILVERAVDEAARRLRTPHCQRVLTDFTDPDGTPIAARLAALGMTADGYLTRWLYFADGTDTPPCKPTRETVAYTVRGGRIIFICPPRGIDAPFSLPGRGVPVIIHEMLHSLGLGENPPSSHEITETVVRRCGG
jgi:hypothetical protein